MKKAEISFRVIGNSGPLSIYFLPGPYGDAVDAIQGSGVGWFSQSGELLGVEFDDVSEKEDDQNLYFKHYRVEIKVRRGKVSYSVSPLRAREHSKKSTSGKRRIA